MSEDGFNRIEAGGESISDALTFQCGPKRYALPVRAVVRLVALRAEDIHPFPVGCDRLEGLFSLGGQIIPVARIPGLECRNPSRAQRSFVVARAGRGLFAFPVDALCGIESAAGEAVPVEADELADRFCAECEAQP